MNLTSHDQSSFRAKGNRKNANDPRNLCKCKPGSVHSLNPAVNNGDVYMGLCCSRSLKKTRKQNGQNRYLLILETSRSSRYSWLYLCVWFAHKPAWYSSRKAIYFPQSISILTEMEERIEMLMKRTTHDTRNLRGGQKPAPGWIQYALFTLGWLTVNNLALHKLSN